MEERAKPKEKPELADKDAANQTKRKAFFEIADASHGFSGEANKSYNSSVQGDVIDQLKKLQTLKDQQRL